MMQVLIMNVPLIHVDLMMRFDDACIYNACILDAHIHDVAFDDTFLMHVSTM